MLADLGFTGLDDDTDDPVIITGRQATRGHPVTAAQKDANRRVSRERAPNEHSFADVQNWRILTKIRMNARHATTLLRALLVLTNAEIRRRPGVADDLRETITAATSVSTPSPAHASPVTCNFRMKSSH